MVRFYDENMNEVYLPKDYDMHYGSHPLALSISSIEYEKQGNKRVPIGRTAILRAFIIASRETDMKLKIKRVYEFFRTLGEFYVADNDTPFELLKVSVDQPYTIEFGDGALIEYEIPLTVYKPYFKQSLHTTQELDKEGVRFNDKWGYGMGLSADSTQWQYSFRNEDPQFYNAGTEDIKLIQQKESEITLKLNAIPPNDFIDIDDGTTIFKLRYEFSIGDTLRISGHNVTLNGNNVLADTNFNFLTVKTGWNYWDIRGVPNHNYEFDIDFRFLYD